MSDLPLRVSATRAAVSVAAGLGVTSSDPEVLADGANVIVCLAPTPVVAKVAASTTAVRPDVAAWLQRELDVAAFLAGAGVPVLTPSGEVPPIVHSGEGQVMTFWTYLAPSGDGPADDATIGSMLRDLHAALRSYPGDMPAMAPLADIPAFLARPQTVLSEADAAALAGAHERLTAELPTDPGQVLHGDAGGGNLMAAGGGWPPASPDRLVRALRRATARMPPAGGRVARGLQRFFQKSLTVAVSNS